jgi:hypothetical protein
LEKSLSHEQLVTGIVANCVKALLKFENIVFRSFSDNQFSHTKIVLVDNPLIEVLSDIFVMSLISGSNVVFKLNFSFNIEISLLSSFNRFKFPVAVIKFKVS